MAVLILGVGTAAMFTYMQNTASLNISISSTGDCHILLNNAINHLNKDESSFFITNMGADAAGFYPVNVAKTDWGHDRYSLGSARVPFLTYTQGTGSLDALNVNREVKLKDSVAYPQFTNQGWKLNNHRNIKNTMNRFVAMANSGVPNFCYQGLGDDLNPQPVGVNVTQFFTPILSQQYNPQLFLTMDLVREGVSLCNSLPVEVDPSENVHVSYKLTAQLTTSKGLKGCFERGRIQYATDLAAPLTLVEVDRSNLCDPVDGVAKKGTPSICLNKNQENVVRYRVMSVMDSPTCRTCMLNLYTTAGVIDPLKGTCTNPVNPIQACGSGANPACIPKDPGSMFFCRMGDKFNRSRDPNNIWEPCHTAGATDTFDTRLTNATFTTTYTNENWQGVGKRTYDTTDRATYAIIEIRGLEADQTYHLDVRSVDTSVVNMGESWCGVSRACVRQSRYGVAVSENILTGTRYFGTGRIGAPRVSDDSSFSKTRGSDWFPASQAMGYSPPAWSDHMKIYQCTQGSGTIVNQVTNYGKLGSGITAGLGIEFCKLNMARSPSGVDLMSNSSCTCDGDGECTGAVTTNSESGWFQTEMHLSNDCDPTQFISNGKYNWCQDLMKNWKLTTGGDVDLGTQGTDLPRFDEAYQGVLEEKTCGTVFFVPLMNKVTDEDLDFYITDPIDLPPRYINHQGCDSGLNEETGSGSDNREAIWVSASRTDGVTVPTLQVPERSACVNIDYGCINSTDEGIGGAVTGGGQACVAVMDMCGRQFDSPDKITFGLHLKKTFVGLYPGKIVDTGVSTNLCKATDAVKKDGNQCEEGSYCGRTRLTHPFRCIESIGCRYYEEECDRNVDETKIAWPESRTCYDEFFDANDTKNHASKVVWGKRCSSTYKCVEPGYELGGVECPREGECSMISACNAPSPQPGSCTLDGADCFNDGACPDALDEDGNLVTANSCSPGPIAGKCANRNSKSGSSCWNDDECTVFVPTGCRLDVQGTCSCPIETSAEGAGSERYCPKISSCGGGKAEKVDYYTPPTKNYDLEEN